jgi:hypothetical protein
MHMEGRGYFAKAVLQLCRRNIETVQLPLDAVKENALKPVDVLFGVDDISAMSVNER